MHPQLQLIDSNHSPLSSLLGAVFPSYCLNRGQRYAKYNGTSHRYEQTAIAVGQVGARMEKDGEHEVNVLKQFPPAIELDQTSTKVRELLTDIARMTGISDNFQSEPCFCILGSICTIRKDLYVARTFLVLQSLFNFAAKYSIDNDTNICLRLTGLGLGFWSGYSYIPHQLSIFALRMCLTRLQNTIHKITTIQIEYWWNDDKPENMKILSELETDSIQIQLTMSGMFHHTRLADELLIVNFAWDGMSYPGNEYYAGEFELSGDTDAAFNSSLGVLGNPKINPNMYERHFSSTIMLTSPDAPTA